jgi:hypothetical protein
MIVTLAIAIRSLCVLDKIAQSSEKTTRSVYSLSRRFPPAPRKSDNGCVVARRVELSYTQIRRKCGSAPPGEKPCDVMPSM